MELPSLESLDSLRGWLESQSNPESLCRLLWEDFLEVVEYQDANEWSRAVTLCEALAIIGWSGRERVDAISHFNGDCWNTCFRTRTGEYRYRQGRWRKRKAGWVLFNPEYYFSPDMPDRPASGWQESAGIEFPIVDRDCLPSQRNYVRQVPVVMGLIGGTDTSSQIVSEMKRDLDALLRKHMKPETYGEPLEFLYFKLTCPFPGSSPRSGLKIGSYSSKQRAFYCDLHFDTSFASRTVDQRIDYFQGNLSEAVEAVRKKFQRKRLVYDFDQFCEHLRDAFTEMRKTSTSGCHPPRSSS